jgi:hypothetical protein
MTHNNDVNEDITSYPEWDLHITQEVLIWKRWHDYWINVARSKEVPVYFFRFEDLLSNPECELSKIFSVSLGVNDLSGTIIEQRI